MFNNTGFVFRKDGPHIGITVNALTEEFDLLKMLLQNGFEFVKVQAMHVKRTSVLRLIAVCPSVWGWDNEQALRSQKSLHLLQKVLVLDVIHSVKADDDFENIILFNGNISYGSHFELKVAPYVFVVGMFYRIFIDIDCDD